MKLSCEKVLEITLMYADCIQEIPDEKAREAYLSHIESCDECRTMRDEILSDISALHSLGDEVPMKNGVTLCESVMQNLKASEKKSHRGFKFRFVGTAVAAVIVAVMFLGSNSSVFKNIFFGDKKMSDSISSEKSSRNQSARSLVRGDLSAYDNSTEEQGDAGKTVYEEKHENFNTADGSANTGSENDVTSSSVMKKDTDIYDAKAVQRKEKTEMFALTAPTANAGDELASYLSAQNERMGLCVVHPAGYHTIPLEYAEKIGYEAFKAWVEGITDEEVEYTPEYFKNHFADNFN